MARSWLAGGGCGVDFGGAGGCGGGAAIVTPPPHTHLNYNFTHL